MTHPVTDLRGARGGPVAPPRMVAGAMAWLYGWGVRAHRGLYRSGLAGVRRVRVPVVSVGAVTVGGAGKTPFVRFLARRLASRGRRPAVLSRGYGSTGGRDVRVVDPDRPDARRDGDEPALLARALPDVPVVVCPDRARAASVAMGRGADVLLLDDGFQHRRLHRDVDVVLWDRRAAEARGRLLPAGPLREPASALGRADFVVLVDRGDGPPEAPRRVDRSRVARARLVTGALQRLEEGQRVHALSGIAGPEAFERSLTDLGLVVTGATRFADHHPFSTRDVRETAARAAAEGAEFLAVTAKDHVRWPRDPSPDLPVPAVFDLQVEMEGEEAWLDALLARIEGVGA